MGIGGAVAKILATEGTKCAVAARRLNRLQRVAQQISVTVAPVPVRMAIDVLLDDAPRKLAEGVLNALDKFKILINGVGRSWLLLVAAPEQRWSKAMTLFFTRVRQLPHAVQADLQKHSSGRIMSKQIRRSYPEAFRSGHASKVIPIARYGKPEELAVLAVVLAAPLAGYIIGTVLSVDAVLRRHTS